MTKEEIDLKHGSISIKDIVISKDEFGTGKYQYGYAKGHGQNRVFYARVCYHGNTIHPEKTYTDEYCRKNKLGKYSQKPSGPPRRSSTTTRKTQTTTDTYIEKRVKSPEEVYAEQERMAQAAYARFMRDLHYKKLEYARKEFRAFLKKNSPRNITGSDAVVNLRALDTYVSILKHKPDDDYNKMYIEEVSRHILKMRWNFDLMKMKNKSPLWPKNVFLRAWWNSGRGKILLMIILYIFVVLISLIIVMMG